MTNYKNEKNEVFPFDDNCFDEQGNCINKYASKIIEENNLVQMTDEENNIFQAQIEAKRLAEEERLSKLPTQEEIEDAKLTVKILEMKELGLI